jgi:bifunctional DNase/RNase
LQPLSKKPLPQKMKKVELEISALQHSITQSHSYAVVLSEVGGERKLPIVIGGFEAQAIAVALEKMQPSRPLTHDLFANFIAAFNIDLFEVMIYKLEEGIFYAKLVCQGPDGDTLEIDSRTSDALALAVRTGSRIYTYDTILDAAGIFMEHPEIRKAITDPVSSGEAATNARELKDMNLEELNELLQQFLDQEDYVNAIPVRDEINSRKTK